ncbi:MAG: DUF5017 domain-containing protein [Bacteroidetes bacterium]|nr:DUF5017 domain-containing protein [Bacteroidota bacterium]
MKKTYFFTLFLFLSSFLIGQNLVSNGDLELWTSGLPDGWDHVENITQESVIVHAGTYSARHQSASGTQDFGHEYITGIVEGSTYTLSYYYFDNDVNAKTRIWSKWLDSSGSQVGSTIESEYSSDNPDWQSYNTDFIAPMGSAQFYLEVRVYKGDVEGGYVYYDDFSFVNDQTIYPEPSNYPTMFSATASGLSINLSWDESTGAQLPTGYLILGEKTASPSFEVPVDGAPVANELDWSDNKVSVNVGYGNGEYLFNGLVTNGTYSFTVYPFTNTGSDIDYKTDGTAPTANATTSNVTVINSEGFDSSLGAWTQYSVTGPQIWEWADYGNPPGCAKGNGYAGGAVENEDWLISPELDMEGYTNITLGFDHARNYASNDGLYVLISTDYEGGDPNTASWEDITSSFTFPDPGSWDFIDAGSMDISDFATDATYIAFLYNSTSSDASTWEIDNIEVLGVMGTGIESPSIASVRVYPNPASDKINIRSEKSGYLNIKSITGQIIFESEIIAGNNSINIANMISGLYIVEISGIDGQKSIGKFIIK